MTRMQGKLCLVTGATSGIGRSTARLLGREGAKVVLAGRRKERLAALAKELPGSETIELDVRDARKVAAALDGRTFDVVVANAGLGRGLGPLQAGESSDWDEMIDTNVQGLLHTVRATLPAMIERGRGDVVVLGSVAGRQVYPGGNVYCATKHAVRALYEAMRIDAARQGHPLHDGGPGAGGDRVLDRALPRRRGAREEDVHRDRRAHAR
jgi:NADP-dependent 3-hydroxy acid dehydrogenase YdfG